MACTPVLDGGLARDTLVAEDCAQRGGVSVGFEPNCDGNRDRGAHIWSIRAVVVILHVAEKTLLLAARLVVGVNREKWAALLRHNAVPPAQQGERRGGAAATGGAGRRAAART
jgi:hypothetical protein